jgi:hypothetical protein
LIAGSVGFLLSWKMTKRLPADGEPPPPKHTGESVFRKVFQLRNLFSFAQAQAKIDSSSDTQ